MAEMMAVRKRNRLLEESRIDDKKDCRVGIERAVLWPDLLQNPPEHPTREPAAEQRKNVIIDGMRTEKIGQDREDKGGIRTIGCHKSGITRWPKHMVLPQIRPGIPIETEEGNQRSKCQECK